MTGLFYKNNLYKYVKTFGGILFRFFPLFLSNDAAILQANLLGGFFMPNTLITPYGAGAMRAHDAAKFLGVAVSTFWRWVKEGRLPKGRRLSSRCTVWLRADIERFLEEGGEA